MTGLTRAKAPAAATSARPAAVVVPDAPASASRSWRKLVTTVDANARGAFALEGAWLDAGVAYELPEGASVIVCDAVDGGYEVALDRVEDGVLTVVKTWELKGPLGKRVTDYIARRLAPGAATHRARRLEANVNWFAARCTACRQEVAAGAGIAEQYGPGSRWQVRHLGQCPPPPPPPEVITPNRYSGLCFTCGGWMEAGTGVAVRLPQQHEATGSWYQPMHAGPCPADALPGPPNRVSGWCADCAQIVSPGEGYWLRDELHHAAACPPMPPERVWLIRKRRREDPYEVGQVRRVGIDSRRGGPEVPVEGPGYRRLGPCYEQLIIVVVQVDDSYRHQEAQVRAASWDEAADLLAAETAAAVDVQVLTEGFKAQWSAERIGDYRPWLAEITGRDPKFDLQRDFIDAQKDYAGSNSKGTRGVYFRWTLAANRVYEAFEPQSRRGGRRLFLRTTAEGDTVEISREEVETWLNNAAPTIAS